jgi:hypothetical protein
MTIRTMRNTYCQGRCPCDGRGPVTSLPPSPLQASGQTYSKCQAKEPTDNNFNKEDLPGKNSRSGKSYITCLQQNLIFYFKLSHE